jgi:2,3-bisphosphoglycerate-dependent phosphoglycerate mutase
MLGGNMKTYIYFVRHAVSPFIYGNENAQGLFEQGKQDTLRVAQLLMNEHINVITSSTYTRAI